LSTLSSQLCTAAYLLFISCFLSIRRLPSPPLFPYTTLFRSGSPQRGLNDSFRTTRAGKPTATTPSGMSVATTDPAPITEPRAGGDRKSTRLNSSHQIISYAVFCLKKKKTKHNNETQRQNSYQ